jgi:hypothetical protein
MLVSLYLAFPQEYWCYSKKEIYRSVPIFCILLDSRCRLYLFDRKWILNFIALNAFAQVTTDRSKVFPKDMEAPPGGVDDMTRLSYLHEPGVLQNLATRYELNEIYVSSLPSLPKILHQINCISCS